jgi:hypothetical protein
VDWYISREKKTLAPNDISMEALIPTQRFDGLLVKEMEGRLETIAHLPAEVLLLGGAKSPAFLYEVLDVLAHTLPRVKRIEYPDLDHSGLLIRAGHTKKAQSASLATCVHFF